MERELRGPGSLVPEHIRWVSALTQARVEQILAHPGDRVTYKTTLLVLSNPEVEIQALEAEGQLSSARAELVSLRTSLENERLTQAGVVASTRTEYLKAQRDAAVADSLAAGNFIAKNDIDLVRDRAAELELRYGIEEERLALLTQAVDSQLAARRTNVERLRAIAEFQDNRVQALRVRAGDSGVVQELRLQLGQWVTPGLVLAKIVQPGELKAVLQIPETQAKDVALGQSVTIDIRTGLVPGKVTQVAPAAQNGTVEVEVGLTGRLPPGARPDLSVDGTILIERLADVLYVGRPAFGQPNSTVRLFKVIHDGRDAVRVTVKLGRSSVKTIEILDGLAPRDQVILSDMSRWDGVDRVRLN
jgi:hypothetical protein